MARGGSWCGSRSRSEGPTATGPAWPIRCCWCPAFPGCRRVTSRLAATRRDRLTSWLPMLRPPHPEGLTGAVRVEVRGWLDGRAETRILGVAAPPSVVAGAVAARAALWAGAGRLARPGAGGLAELVDAPGSFLRDLAPAGITVTAFQGGELEG